MNIRPTGKPKIEIRQEGAEIGGLFSYPAVRIFVYWIALCAISSGIAKVLEWLR